MAWFGVCAESAEYTNRRRPARSAGVNMLVFPPRLGDLEAAPCRGRLGAFFLKHHFISEK
jgi:hypothetical protein